MRERYRSASGAEASAALGTATLDDGATGPCPHAVAETVLALASAHVWLIGTFHGKRIQKEVRGSGPVGYEPFGRFAKAGSVRAGAQPSGSCPQHPAHGHQADYRPRPDPPSPSRCRLAEPRPRRRPGRGCVRTAIAYKWPQVGRSHGTARKVRLTRERLPRAKMLTMQSKREVAA